MTYIPSKKDRDLRKRFGDRLAMARMKKGLTQEQLAGMIGKGTQTISNWERGYYYPGEVDTILKLAEILECDPDFLLDRLDESTHDIHFVHDHQRIIPINITIDKDILVSGIIKTGLNKSDKGANYIIIVFGIAITQYQFMVDVKASFPDIIK